MTWEQDKLSTMFEAYERKRRIRFAFVVLLLLTIIVETYWAWSLNSRRWIATCADFSSQSEAEQALSSQPQLDADHDGIACEAYIYPHQNNDIWPYNT